MYGKMARLVPRLRMILEERDWLRNKTRALESQNKELSTGFNAAKKQIEAAQRKLEDDRNPLNSHEYKIASKEQFSISPQLLTENKKSIGNLISNPKSALWFIPSFSHVSYGGIFTILRFAELMTKKGLDVHLVIYANRDSKHTDQKEQITDKFPALAKANIIYFNTETDTVDSLPSADIGVCTLWDSAYLLLKYNHTKEKCYFIQDFEPSFYAGGAVYSLVESTYRFGFKGIVNTPGLEKSLQHQYGLQSISFVPAVDREYYYHDKEAKKKDGVIRIFFYARPTKPRNAFPLGRAVILDIKNKYGDKVEIITAGSEWNEDEYGLKGKITNLGLLNSIEEVGELYRKCDISFSFMMSRHPSYQPFELMASGVAYVTNTNEFNEWFLKDGVNCLVSEPSPTLISEKIGELIEDGRLREGLVDAALKELPNSEWDKVMESLWSELNAILVNGQKDM